MKYFIKRVVLIILVSTMILACSSEKKRNANFLPPLTIKISNEIKNDEKLVEVVKSSEKAINEFSDNLEQLVLEGKEILDKNEDERSLTENYKIGKMMIQFVSNSVEFGKLIDEFDTYRNNQKEQGLINNEQIKALEKVGESFRYRMKQINDKYEF